MSQYLIIKPFASLRWRIIGIVAIALVAILLVFNRERLGDGLHPLNAWRSHSIGPPLEFTIEVETQEEMLRKASPPLPSPDKEEYVAICMAVKDQHLDLPEFLVHHYYHMGIRRFYIMDDGSKPPLSIAVEKYGIPHDAITFEYLDIPDRPQHMQHWIYQHCQDVYGKKHTWIAYLDADEFLEMRHTNETLVDFLHEFNDDPKVGAVGINWRMHTSSSQLTRQKSTRKTYTTCIYDDPEHSGTESDNRHVKSIVKTAFFAGVITPHVFNTGPDAKTVGEDGKEYAEGTSSWRTPITRERVSLHHYAVKSKQEYEEKMMRSNAMGQAKGWEFWNHVEDMPHVPCLEMEGYYP